jgi:Alternate to MurJ
MTRVLVVGATMAIIHAVMTYAYAVRLAGVRTGRLAISLSLYNIIFLAASTANAIQVPVLAKLVEETIIAAHGNYQTYLGTLLGDLRFSLAGAVVGTLFAAITLPSFVNIFVRGIMWFEETGSLPKLLKVAMNTQHLRALIDGFRLPRWSSVSGMLSVRAFLSLPIPKGFLIANIFITAFHAAGLQAAMYAGGLLPEFRTTASSLTSVMYGGATLGLALFVDPVAAMITDQALRGDRTEEEIQLMVRYLVMTRMMGTVLAQFVLVPGAYAIAWVAQRI